MRRCGHAAMGFALVRSALLPSLPARAWTEARIESAGAALELMPEGRAHVNLRVGLRVLGGWLSKLELDGLDAGLVLDPDQPPAVRTEDGERLLPEVRMHRDGRFVLSFPSRSGAPHRGRHELELHYVARLGSEPDRGGRRVLRWALPAFRADLRDVDVTVDAPAGTAVSGDADGAVTRTTNARGER